MATKPTKTVQRPKPTGKPVTIPPPAKRPPAQQAAPAAQAARPAQRQAAPAQQARATAEPPSDPNHPLNAPPAERWPEKPSAGLDDGIPAALRRTADNKVPSASAQPLATANISLPATRAPAIISNGGGALARLEATGETGFETVTQQDLIIPRITILQDLSPQVKPQRSEYIEGAEAGHIFDTATGVLANEIEVIPAYFERRFIEWAAGREGFVADHGVNATRYRECGGDGFRFAETPEGNLIQPTMTFYVVNISEGGLQSLLPMASVFMKHGKHWMSVMSSYIIPGTSRRGNLWSRGWKLSTVPQQNDKGDWWGWQIDPVRPIEDYGDQIVESIFSFREILKAGAYASASQIAEDQSDAQGLADNAGADATM